MKAIYSLSVFILIMAVSLDIYAVEPDSSHKQFQAYEFNLQIIERLAKLEEGQRSIIVEMRTRFEAIEKRFEVIDQRFEVVYKRFEVIDQRFEAVLREMDKRFEAVEAKIDAVHKRIDAVHKRIDAVHKRIDDVDKRIDSVNKRMDQMNTYFLTMTGTFVSVVIAIIGFGVWDRKTILVKAKEETELLVKNYHDHHHKESPAFNAQEKYQQIIDIMKKLSENIPEMRSMMQTANLL
jgi:archaellum component FlaC